MKRIVSLAVAAAALVAASGAASAQSKEPIRLPMVSAFSGPFVDFGERQFREGLMPAVKIINEQGGINGRPIEFYKVDNRFPDTTAFLADFRRLCEDKSVPMIFGIGATKTTVATYEELKRCGITIFNPSSAGAWPAPDFGGWIYRYQPDAAQVIPILLKRTHQKFGFKTIALSHTLDDDATVANIKFARQTLNELGVKIVSDVSFKNKETNFASQVAAHRQSNPDAVWFSHQPADAGTFLLQLRERGMAQQALTDSIIGSVDFWKLAQAKAIGTIGYALYTAEDQRPIVQDYVKLWRELTGKKDQNPDSFVAAYYDATFVLAEVLRKVKDLNNREEIRDAFLKISNMETISGTVGWKTQGDVVRPEPVLVQVHDNFVLKRWMP